MHDLIQLIESKGGSILRSEVAPEIKIPKAIHEHNGMLIQKKVYLAYAITGQKDLLYPYRVGLHLRSLGYDVFVPHIKNAHLSEPYVIFQRDFEALMKADLMVVLLDHPSFGVGLEMALGAKKPMFCYSLKPGTSKYVQGFLFEMNQPAVKTCSDEAELFLTMTKDLT